MSEQTICIYHNNCADGFTSAWVVNKAYKESAPEFAFKQKAIEFHGGIFGQQPPDTTDKDVILVDFSYKKETMLEIANRSASVTILDHHISAYEDLKPLLDDGTINGIFDMNRSGAMITWDYFFPNTKCPKLIEHVQDRDLWQFKLDGTRVIQSEVFSHEYTFENWDMLMLQEISTLVERGTSIERKHLKDVVELLGVVQRKEKIAGIEVPVANLPYTMSSDAGAIMSLNNPFAACYYDTPSGRCYSLRSNSNNPAAMDVSKIALLYGGGGHKNAAGFVLPWDKTLNDYAGSHVIRVQV